MEPYYFAEDGNFGSAEGLAIFDTTNWTEDDWMEIEQAGDHARVQVAREIAEHHITLDGGVTWAK